MAVPQNLLDEFGKGHGVVFVGAGLSKGAGLPDWKELMRPLAEELKRSPDEDPIKIAQYYQNTRGLAGRNLLVQHVKRMLNKPGAAPTRNHELVAQLRAPIIFTTNFDNLLERALATREIQRIVRDKNVGYWDWDKINLVKLHGSLDDEEILVITSDDYAAYFRSHANITRALSALLMTHTFLFIGYSLSDPDLWQIYNQIRFDLAEHKRPAYAVFLNGDPLELDNLQRGGIIPINLPVPPSGDYNATLGAFLDEFLKRLPAPAPKISTPPAPTTPVDQLAARIEKLLAATGYETIAREQHPPHQIYLTVCADRGSPRETRWVVACRTGEIEIADVRALARAMSRVNAARAYLVSEARVLPTVRDEARATEDRVRVCTLDAFYRELADFTPYAQYLVQQWERDPLSQYYIDLGGRRQQRDADGKPVGEGDPRKPIDDYLDEWLDVPGGNHISILGDYGTGKTTLVKQYAAKLARRYLAQPEKSRIPILISLREYSKAMNLRQLITDFIVNEQRERIRLDGAFAAFEQLNRDGKFILIFDGFDEMARQVSYQTTVNNFDELAKAAEGDAKVLLTCRKHYFHEAREERSVLSGEASMQIARERGDATRIAEHPGGKEEPGIVLRAGFETVYLDEFTPDDITLLLQKRFPAQWREYDARIRNTYNLTDLAKRPVLLDMIAQTLGEWGDRKITNAAQLYHVCTERWMERDINIGRAFLNQDDKRKFSEELAVEVFRTGQLTGIPYAQFPAIIKKHFSRLERVDEIDHFAQDIFTRGFLIRDDDGKYRFAHNSFMEFFIAQKLGREMSQEQIVIASSPTASRLLAMTETFNISEEIRAFIYGLFDGKLPAFTTPRRAPEGMVYIPPGPFVMGGEIYDSEKPTRIATLANGFFIDQSPVTQAQYKKFVDATRRAVPNVDTEWALPYNWDKKTRTFPTGLDNHPVVLVSWDDATAYAKWAGKRLPTEIEWEKAARGIDGRVYPWGDEWDWHKCNSASWWVGEDLLTYDDWDKKFKPRWEKEWQGKQVMTTPVGDFKDNVSPYGCVDMVGNVWEWTADWYNDEKKTPAVRGGSWSNPQGNARGAVRGSGNPGYRYGSLGFRCAE